MISKFLGLIKFIKKKFVQLYALMILRLNSYDMVFYVVRPFQETYLISIIDELADKYKIALLRVDERDVLDGKWIEVESDIDIFSFSPRLLKHLKIPLFITPETFEKRASLPDSKYCIHVPHSPVSLHMIYPQGRFNAFDVLFAVGEHHVKEFAALRNNDSILTFPVGYTRSDYLIKEYSVYKKKQSQEERKVVLIAPSWHEDNILEVIGIDLVGDLLQKDYYIIFRPHYKIAELKPEFIESLQNKFAGFCNFTIDVAGANNLGIFKADLLISDYSGIAFEYAFLREKPVLFIDTPPKERNFNWKSLGIEPIEISLRNYIGKVVPAERNALLDAVEYLFKNNDSYKTSIKEIRELYYYNYYYGTGKKAAIYLEDLLANNEELAITSKGSV